MPTLEYKLHTYEKIVLLLITTVFIVHNCKSQSRQTKNDVVKIEIKSVDFLIRTVVRVDCDAFDANFKSGVTHITLTTKDNINTIMNSLNSMKRISNDYEVDTRCKILIFHSNKKIDTICLSQLVVRYKNLNYQTPQALIDFINKTKSYGETK